MTKPVPPIWTPSEERVEKALLTQFLARVDADYDLHLKNYDELHRWSVENSEQFWDQLWDFADVIGTKGTLISSPGPAKHGDFVPARDTLWFEDSTLNYAENLLAQAFHTPERTAVCFHNEQGEKRTLSWQELCDQVSLTCQWLEDCGVGPGDVVAGYLPNIPETLVAMLATAAKGAVWTSTSPDFGVESAAERFGQVDPKVLFVVDGYCFNGQAHTLRDKNHQLAEALPSLTQTCQINYLHPESEDGFSEWHHMLDDYRPVGMRYERRRFNDPLFILYSSGTTGKPKCIVHSVGGTLLNHVKEHQLHCDIHSQDVVFCYSTTGWMMWNWQMSALASGAELVIYDGHPCYPDNNILWHIAKKHGVTLFGTSPKYLETLQKDGYRPAQHYSLDKLKTLCSTSSVLHPHQFEFVYQHIKPDLHLASISGGTDICGCFVLGNPISPVYPGECQQAALGLDVCVFNPAGDPVQGTHGTLVCRNSFPNQPLYFCQDNGRKYHQTYWNRFPGTWYHGDEVCQTPQNGFVFCGRSDAMLNRYGMRIGSAEIYREVNRLARIEDSVVVSQKTPTDNRIVLFVQMAQGLRLDDEDREAINHSLRENASPHHIPDLILPLSEVPRTRSGKLVELAVKNVLEHKPVTNTGALSNPDVLEELRNMEPQWRVID